MKALLSRERLASRGAGSLLSAPGGSGFARPWDLLATAMVRAFQCREPVSSLNAAVGDPRLCVRTGCAHRGSSGRTPLGSGKGEVAEVSGASLGNIGLLGSAVP